MAGSIGLSLSQQLDITNGRLLSGGKLYFYASGTSTPQNVFRDTALTLAYPNPITLASDGRVPAFYVADGAIRARLTNSAGVVQFDADGILVIGPSSGSGGGISVDPTTLFQTGDMLWLDQSGTRSGFVRDNGRTIGAATSGASERANADCQPLFLFLWATYSDTICPVLTGRGLTAAADWAANKQITLPDKRGYIPGGLDDMGNSAAGRFTSVPVVSGSVTTAGSVLGESLHTITVAESAALTLTSVVTDPGHHHNMVGSGGPGNQHVTITSDATDRNTNTADAVTGITVATTSNAGGGSHNNVQKTVLGTYYRKL